MTPPDYESVPARAGYDRWAEIYDGEDNPLVLLEERHIYPLLGPVAGHDVLDAGCGTGRHALRLADAGGRVTAFDFSASMLSRARLKAGERRVRFLEHDITRPLPFETAAFGATICSLVLEHVAALEPVLRELVRVTRPGAAIVVSELHPAMRLRGVSARFTDPSTGRETRPQSHAHTISALVMAALGSGATLEHLSEHVVDAEQAASSPRSQKYLDWPMLVMMKLRA